MASSIDTLALIESFKANKNEPIELLIKQASLLLQQSGSPSPSVDAIALLCHVLDKPRSYLFTWPEKPVSDVQFFDFVALLSKRMGGEPVAYILGKREFWSLELQVSPATLIPRPDTERLVELALTKVSSPSGLILDLGTGTGAIALALASELPQHLVVGIDYQHEAKLVAESNAQSLNIANSYFVQGSWFEPLAGNLLSSHQYCQKNRITETKFCLIVSNPPYIEQDDPHLSMGDVRFEPITALVAKDDGMADIKHIASKARDYLENGGWLLFEHGFEQGEAVRQYMVDLGYTNVATEKDYGGNDRVTLGQYFS